MNHLGGQTYNVQSRVNRGLTRTPIDPVAGVRSRGAAAEAAVLQGAPAVRPEEQVQRDALLPRCRLACASGVFRKTA